MQKQQVNIWADGGTILGQEHQIDERRRLVHPTWLQLQRQIEHISQETGVLLSNIVAHAHNLGLVDSTDHNPERIEQVVEHVRKTLGERKGSLVVPTGTDGVGMLGCAIANAVSKDELGDRSIVIATSKMHPDHPDTDAFSSFEQAIRLAVREEMRGRMAITCDGGAWGARGTEKVKLMDGEDAIISRAPTLGHVQDNGFWSIDRGEHPADQPWGRTGEPYKIARGVESVGFDGLCDYCNLRHMVDGGRAANTLSAVIARAPGPGNLRSNPRDRRILRDISMDHPECPIVIAGDMFQMPPPPMDDAVSNAGIRYSYVGDPDLIEDSRLINALDLRPFEAKLLTAQALVELSDRVTIGSLARAVQFRMTDASRKYATTLITN